jgi:3-dehydroquinate synthase
MLNLVFHSILGPSRLHLRRSVEDELATSLAAHPAPRLLLTESRVARAQGFRQERVMDQTDMVRLVLPEGESAKNSANLLTVLGEMAESGLERGSPLLAWGGGMVGDLGGLAASLWMRGVPFLFAPTSLLAMVDASLGGKTAINFAGRRNAVGCFWPAREVWMGLDALSTLPEREWSSGFGELLKAAWLSDDGWARQLEEDPGSWLRWDHPALPGHVERALRFKLAVVEEDERESGRRTLLNLGHSLGHVLEEHAEDDPPAHGHAVLLGMLAVAHVAGRAGVATPAATREMTERLVILLRGLGLLPRPELAREPVTRWVAAMARDKKVQAGRLRLVLPVRVGEAVVAAVGPGVLEAGLEDWRRSLA